MTARLYYGRNAPKPVEDAKAAVPMGKYRAQHCVSRCRVGRSLPRRPGAIRAADPGGRPGGAELVDDSEQTQRLPAGVRSFRSAARGALRLAKGQAVARQPGNRTEP